MEDTCELWLMNKNVNPRTRRKIISDGPVFKKLERECVKALARELSLTRSRGILSEAKRLAKSFDSRVFENKFRDLEIVVEKRDFPESFVKNGKIVIVLPSSYRSIEKVAQAIIHEMCLIAASMFGGTNFDFWRRKASAQFPRLKQVLKCYPKVSGCDPCGNGKLFVAGAGDCGQLGLGPDVFERSKMTRSPLDLQCVQACAGGLHTLCLTADGSVFSFGCNDEFALGRETLEEEDSFEPGIVSLKNRIVRVSAGGSHSAALTDDGNVYAWGTFRDSDGAIGLLSRKRKPVEKPTLLNVSNIVKISSGSDHILFLRDDGTVFSMGINDQNQLGRVISQRKYSLTPLQVKIPEFVVDVWACQYGSIAKTIDNEIYVWGLNNYFQLGEEIPTNPRFPTKPKLFNDRKIWKSFSGADHHSLAISAEGDLYSIGNEHYGRLGVERDFSAQEAKLFPVMKNCESASTGPISSYAISDGRLFSWGGAGAHLALGKNETDVAIPTLVPIGDRRCVSVSGGGQHVVALMCE